jgi:hypothetical protein
VIKKSFEIEVFSLTLNVYFLQCGYCNCELSYANASASVCFK